jgi:hypothetical protein
MGKFTDMLRHPDELVPMVRRSIAGHRTARSGPTGALEKSTSAELALAPFRPLPVQVAMYYASKRALVLPKDESLRFCYEMLNRVSRR